ncbi:MAG: PAS domain-containing protein [Nodosilinea sp.]
MAHLQPQTVTAEDGDLAPAGPPPDPSSTTVLLVSSAANQALQQLLPPGSQGDRFLETHTLSDALHLWRRGKANWVLLDLAEPEGHGLAFLAAIAATVAQRPLPVTALVQPGQERAALEAMKLGAADYLYSAELTPKTLLTSLELHRQAWASTMQQTTVAMPNGYRYYKNLVDNSPDVIERFDLQKRHLYVSPALSKFTGIDSSVFLGKTCRELGMDEAMVNAWEAAVETLLAQGEQQTIEFSTPTLIGLRHFEMVLAPEWSASGQIESILCISRDISDRTVAQQAEQLRHELSLLEQTLESILAGYWDIDFVAQTAYMSSGLKRIFGYADHELPDRLDTWQTLIFPADLPIALSGMEAHIQSRGAVPYYNEVRYRHKDGSTVWVICAGQVIDWDEAGQPLYMVGCHVDITQLKQAEAELQTHRAHLQTAQRIGNLGSWELDLQTQGITWSDQVYRIFGRDPASGPPSLEALTRQIHPDDVDHYQHTVSQAITAGKAYDQEFRILPPDGRLTYIQAKGERVVDSDGQPTHLMGTVQDISDRKQAETQLRSLSLRLRLALESANIGIWERIMGSDEVIWDQCLVDLYGFGDLDHSATYQEWRNRVYADDIQRVEAGHQALLDNDTPYDLDFRVWRGDGTLGWIRSSALVRRDAQGQPLSIIGINYDITDRKLAEQQILRTTAQLETSNLELEAFAYSVSHDLRAPLRAIDGFSRALVEDYFDQFDDEGRDYFDRIRHNVGRMGQLIDDLLRLSRVSRSTMVYAPVDLSALVQAQINELHTAEPDRVVTAVIIPDIVVSADPTLMQVALANLVQNAWKFTAHHTAATLEFGVEFQGSEPVYYLRDDGAGFDMAYANKLFGVFQRLHNTDEFPGTGIGLATVQRAIHRHGSRVWAEAAVERGATFYFTLPSVPLPLESQP